MAKPEVIRTGLLNIQICVPEGFSDAEATAFVNNESPTGISSPWSMLKDGDPALGGYHSRTKCEERDACVHIKG